MKLPDSQRPSLIHSSRHQTYLSNPLPTCWLDRDLGLQYRTDRSDQCTSQCPDQARKSRQSGLAFRGTNRPKASPGPITLSLHTLRDSSLRLARLWGYETPRLLIHHAKGESIMVIDGLSSLLRIPRSLSRPTRMDVHVSLASVSCIPAALISAAIADVNATSLRHREVWMQGHDAGSQSKGSKRVRE